MKRIVLIILLLSGCTPYIDKTELKFREERLNTNQSRTIDDALKNDFSSEWSIVGKNGVPELGIAFSGGGTRAASFSIGVLQALHENDVLNDVDIISSVSGGSYAAYWYYSQHFYMDQVAKTKRYSAYKYDRSSIFKNFDLTRPNYCLSGKNDFCKDRNRMEYRFQRHLEDRSDIFVRSVAKRNQIIDYIEKAFLWVPSIATHLITDFVFDWDINSNPLRKFYENGLERTYGYVPLDKIKDPIESKRILAGKNYVNAKDFIFFKRVYAEPLTFKDLRDHISLKRNDDFLRLPFWVINTTTSIGDRPHWFRGIANKSHYSEELSDNVFEFTPLGFGSSSYGFVTQPSESIDVSRAVAISGAAVDGQFGGGISPLINILNLNLGYATENYNTTKTQRIIHSLLPFPLYFFHHPEQSEKNQSIYLSDGGHSENLGLYSLIRRGVKRIIVVDAEYDPEGKFEAFNIVKEKIKNEYNLVLEFDNDDFDCYTPKNTNIHMVKGKVRGFSETSTNGQPYEIDIYYLKLSVDPTFIADECKNSNKLCTIQYQIGTQPNFPHHSTADIQYSKKQVAAYRDLGYLLGKEITRSNLMLP